MRIQKATLAFLVIFGLPYSFFAQTSYGGQPIGLQKAFQSLAKSNPITTVDIAPINYDALEEADLKSGNDIRIATGEDVQFSLENAGSWTTLTNGDRLWRLEINTHNSLGVSLLYKDMYIPEGGRMFVYSQDGSSIKGSYDARNNKDSGKFMAGIISGSTAIIEYYEPKAVSGLGYFEVYKVFKVYKASAIHQGIAKDHSKDFGDAAGCHVNINCTDADDYQDLKKGVARITMVFDNAMGFCTGTLMNNVREDGTPYILSAFHCAQGAPNPDYDLWQFDFNYEGMGCDNPTTEPVAQSIQGCAYRSGREQSDFLLLEISQALPSDFDVRYHGWDRSDAVPDSAVMIHHPQGDVMKFSTTFDNITVFPNPINWNTGVQTPSNHHFDGNLDIGAFETGSSGCAYINQDGRVIGQLNGGTAACSDAQTYIGRFFQSWSNTVVNNSLQPFLDPENTGVMTLDARIPDMNPSISIGGKIADHNGTAMNNITVELSGDITMTATTNSGGEYIFEDLPANGTYTITPVKNDNHLNGLAAGDILTLTRDILGIKSLDMTAQFIAADPTANENISTGDILAIRRVILGINTTFPASASWRFYTSDFPAGLSEINPFTASSTAGAIDAITLSGQTTSMSALDFVGIKIGDLNFSADPNK